MRGSRVDAEAALMAAYTETLQVANPWAAGPSVLAGGATHESWRLDPFPVVFARAAGAEKWDVAGRRYVDLWTGHGALLLGNAHPAIVEAVIRQVQLGQHVGGVHALHYAWGERIRSLVPSCERIRFTASGTEATMLAMRVARAWTGRPRVVRVDGNYHGWHDEALAHALPAERGGFNPGVAEYVSVVPPLDTGAVADELAEGDVAAIILEPGGGSSGSLPWAPAYLASLRQLANSHGVVLIFDEVISGFRYAPGGVQSLANVLPDLTVLAKIAAGGMPGGMVGGRADVMSVISGGSSASGAPAYVVHAGTFNGSPLSAAAALATLELVADGSAQREAEGSARELVDGINAAARVADVDVRAFHQSSIFHILIGAEAEGATIGPGPAAVRLTRERSEQYRTLRRALLLEGVDCHPSHGWLSTAHGPREIADAITGFERSFTRVREIPAFRASLLRLAESPRDCEGECHVPTCHSRFRAVAGCSLPLAEAVAPQGRRERGS